MAAYKLATQYSFFDHANLRVLSKYILCVSALSLALIVHSSIFGTIRHGATLPTVCNLFHNSIQIVTFSVHLEHFITNITCNSAPKKKKKKNSLTNELHYLVFSDGQTDVMHLNCFHNHFISDAVISGTLYLFSSSTLENHMRVMGMEGDNKMFIFKPLITIILEFWDEAITSKAFKINF